MDSGFSLLCQTSYQSIPTLPWKTMKVIKVINVFVCISYVFFTLPPGQGFILIAPIWRSNKPYWFSHTFAVQWKYALYQLGMADIWRLKCHWDLLWLMTWWNIRVTEVWHVCTFCCQTDYPFWQPLFPLLRALFCAGTGPTVSVTMATISVSGG